MSHTTNTVRLVAHVRLRWWLRLYLYGVAFMAALMDAEPDMDKVGRQIKRGLVMKIEPVRFGIHA